MVLGQPTIRPRCPRNACGKTLGPYYYQDKADEALAQHERMAHVDVRPATPFVRDTTIEPLPWPRDAT